MSKSTIIGAVVAVVVIGGGGVVLIANRSSDKKSNDSNMHMNSSSNNNGGSGTNATATNSVSIDNFAFSPASVTVKKGTAVTWTNEDSVAHTVTETDGQSGPNSGSLATGKTYSFTYNTAGTFKYHCAIHPEMTGTVTVTD